jgi:hypothetical protein
MSQDIQIGIHSLKIQSKNRTGIKNDTNIRIIRQDIKISYYYIKSHHGNYARTEEQCRQNDGSALKILKKKY